MFIFYILTSGIRQIVTTPETLNPADWNFVEIFYFNKLCQLNTNAKIISFSFDILYQFW